MKELKRGMTIFNRKSKRTQIVDVKNGVITTIKETKFMPSSGIRSEGNLSSDDKSSRFKSQSPMVYQKRKFTFVTPKTNNISVAQPKHGSILS